MSDKKGLSVEDKIKKDLASSDNVALAKPNFFERKYKKIKKAGKEFWTLGKTGFIYGGIIGSSMGFLVGIVTAYQTKSLIFIPVSMLGSACFFAGIMSVGACLRSEELKGKNALDCNILNDKYGHLIHKNSNI